MNKIFAQNNHATKEYYRVEFKLAKTLISKYNKGYFINIRAVSYYKYNSTNSNGLD